MLAMKSIPKRARFLRSARSAGNADSIQLPTWEQRGGRKGEVELYVSIYLSKGKTNHDSVGGDRSIASTILLVVLAISRVN